MKYLFTNRLGALRPSGWHPEAGVVFSLIHPVSVVCTTLLPSRHDEHPEGRDWVGFAIFLWCLDE